MAYFHQDTVTFYTFDPMSNKYLLYLQELRHPMISNFSVQDSLLDVALPFWTHLQSCFICFLVKVLHQISLIQWSQKKIINLSCFPDHLFSLEWYLGQYVTAVWEMHQLSIFCGICFWIKAGCKKCKKILLGQP